MEYIDFLKSKVQVAPVSGFEASPEMLSECLKPHQKDAVLWALRGGRRALFEAFGLGKTVQELEWCRLVAEHEGGQVLIVLPLGVRQEFTRDAEQLLHAVVLPCKIGDEVWGLKKCRYRTSPAKGVVHHMYFGEDMRLCICVRNVCRGEWGKNVFATKEEAESALAKMDGDGNG